MCSEFAGGVDYTWSRWLAIVVGASLFIILQIHLTSAFPVVPSVHDGPLKIAEEVYVTEINNISFCYVDGDHYYDGDLIPTIEPCESCICHPPGFVCSQTTCSPPPAGCTAVVSNSHQCCPDYVCNNETEKQSNLIYRIRPEDDASSGKTEDSWVFLNENNEALTTHDNEDVATATSIETSSKHDENIKATSESENRFQSSLSTDDDRTSSVVHQETTLSTAGFVSDNDNQKDKSEAVSSNPVDSTVVTTTDFNDDHLQHMIGDQPSHNVISETKTEDLITTVKPFPSSYPTNNENTWSNRSLVATDSDLKESTIIQNNVGYHSESTISSKDTTETLETTTNKELSDSALSTTVELSSSKQSMIEGNDQSTKLFVEDNASVTTSASSELGVTESTDLLNRNDKVHVSKDSLLTSPPLKQSTQTVNYTLNLVPHTEQTAVEINHDAEQNVLVHNDNKSAAKYNTQSVFDTTISEIHMAASNSYDSKTQRLSTAMPSVEARNYTSSGSLRYLDESDENSNNQTENAFLSTTQSPFDSPSQQSTYPQEIPKDLAPETSTTSEIAEKDKLSKEPNPNVSVAPLEADQHSSTTKITESIRENVTFSSILYDKRDEAISPSGFDVKKEVEATSQAHFQPEVSTLRSETEVNSSTITQVVFTENDILSGSTPRSIVIHTSIDVTQLQETDNLRNEDETNTSGIDTEQSNAPDNNSENNGKNSTSQPSIVSTTGVNLLSEETTFVTGPIVFPKDTMATINEHGMKPREAQNVTVNISAPTTTSFESELQTVTPSLTQEENSTKPAKLPQLQYRIVPSDLDAEGNDETVTQSSEGDSTITEESSSADDKLETKQTLTSKEISSGTSASEQEDTVVEEIKPSEAGKEDVTDEKPEPQTATKVTETLTSESSSDDSKASLDDDDKIALINLTASDEDDKQSAEDNISTSKENPASRLLVKDVSVEISTPNPKSVTHSEIATEGSVSKNIEHSREDDKKVEVISSTEAPKENPITLYIDNGKLEIVQAYHAAVQNTTQSTSITSTPENVEDRVNLLYSPPVEKGTASPSLIPDIPTEADNGATYTSVKNERENKAEIKKEGRIYTVDAVVTTSKFDKVETETPGTEDSSTLSQTTESNLNGDENEEGNSENSIISTEIVSSSNVEDFTESSADTEGDIESAVETETENPLTFKSVESNVMSDDTKKPLQDAMMNDCVLHEEAQHDLKHIGSKEIDKTLENEEKIKQRYENEKENILKSEQNLEINSSVATSSNVSEDDLVVPQEKYKETTLLNDDDLLNDETFKSTDLVEDKPLSSSDFVQQMEASTVAVSSVSTVTGDSLDATKEMQKTDEQHDDSKTINPVTNNPHEIKQARVDKPLNKTVEKEQEVGVFHIVHQLSSLGNNERTKPPTSDDQQRRESTKTPISITHLNKDSSVNSIDLAFSDSTEEDQPGTSRDNLPTSKKLQITIGKEAQKNKSADSSETSVHDSSVTSTEPNLDTNDEQASNHSVQNSYSSFHSQEPPLSEAENKSKDFKADDSKDNPEFSPLTSTSSASIVTTDSSGPSIDPETIKEEKRAEVETEYPGQVISSSDFSTEKDISEMNSIHESYTHSSAGDISSSPIMETTYVNPIQQNTKSDLENQPQIFNIESMESNDKGSEETTEKSEKSHEYTGIKTPVDDTNDVAQTTTESRPAIKDETSNIEIRLDTGEKMSVEIENQLPLNESPINQGKEQINSAPSVSYNELSKTTAKSSDGLEVESTIIPEVNNQPSDLLSTIVPRSTQTVDLKTSEVYGSITSPVSVSEETAVNTSRSDQNTSTNSPVSSTSQSSSDQPASSSERAAGSQMLESSVSPYLTSTNGAHDSTLTEGDRTSETSENVIDYRSAKFPQSGSELPKSDVKDSTHTQNDSITTTLMDQIKNFITSTLPPVLKDVLTTS